MYEQFTMYDDMTDAELRAILVRDALKAAGIPPKDRDLLSSGKLDDTAAVIAVREHLDGDKRLLVLSGPPGLGKTTAAGLAVVELERRHRAGWEADVRTGWRERRERDRAEAEDYRRRFGSDSFLAVEHLRETENEDEDTHLTGRLRRLASGYGRELREPPALFMTAHRLSRVSQFDAEAWEKLEAVPLLLIDDLGSEFSDAKGYFAAQIDALFNHRYAYRSRTIATTNLNLEQFEARYGSRVVDRLHEAGEFIELDGESLRRAG